MRGEPGVDARFRRIQVQGTFDGPLSQGDLDRMAEQVGGWVQGTAVVAGHCNAGGCGSNSAMAG